ncbi:MAG TPA: toll/interleukin-1 receptor domain-containing protein, partial [Terricaulis sp.]|nr:toll/interleukin-1 receptor domain-containing protein [Terricaulis sp.]
MAEAGQGLRVFISYARRDCAAFAEELLQGLELAGFDPFLDRHDIAAGEDWESRLSNLIHSADTVVFVISPSAVTSDRCAWEVERAQAISKRIIPIVAIDVPEAETPEGLRRRNYIFFSQGHSFVGALAQLSKALRTDVEWIREHTRLGELAERWRAKQKAEPMLLRGSELEGAKTWLAAWKAPAPEPTNAHREFIGESEAVELNRFSDERKRLEEVAALQAEKALVLARSRRRLKLGVAAVVVLLGVSLASMAAALVLYFQNEVTKQHLAETNQRLILERASALARERAALQAAGEPVAEAPDPVLERLGRLRAELVEAPAASAAPRATRAEPAGDRLSPSFRLSEFTYSATAERLGLSNTPTPE